MNAYREAGYQSRDEYLTSLAEDFGLPLPVVLAAADMLGPNEDFDGLITELEDACDSIKAPVNKTFW
jgi:hypothetical protein